MTIIYSGKGNGMFPAGVTEDNMLETCAVIRYVDLFCNQVKGDSYSLLINQTPTGPGSCFCYVKNLSSKDLVVSSVKVQCASDELFQAKLSDLGNPVGGVDYSLINRKAGCGHEAWVVCKLGNALTGLSGGALIEHLKVKGGESSKRFEWLSGFVLPKNHVITLYTATGTALVIMTVSLHFCECM